MPKKKAATKVAKTIAAKRAIQKTTKEAAKSHTKPTPDEVMAAINQRTKSNTVRRAKDMDSLYLLRRPTGITSLDIALAGGFPASAPIVLVGPDGSGKDLILGLSAAETQRIYGEDFCMVALYTEFKPDKPFLRNVCGLKIAFSPEEVEQYDEARQKAGFLPLEPEERAELRTQIGKIYVIDGVTAEEGFDAVMDFTVSNTCQIAIINSVGSLQTEAKEAADSFTENPQQSNESVLITKFMSKLAMNLNNDRNGRNETTLMIVNQMRAKRNAMPVRGRPVLEKDGYEPGAKAWSLRHGKAIELTLHKGTKYRDEVSKTLMGRVVNWELTKGKLGTHDGKNGNFDFFFDSGVDIVGDLHACCKQYGLIEGAGWVTYVHPEFGFKANGKEGVRRLIQENDALRQHLREECLRAAGVVYRYR